MRPTTGMSDSGRDRQRRRARRWRGWSSPRCAAIRLVSPWQRNTMARPAITWLTRSTTTSSGEEQRDDAPPRAPRSTSASSGCRRVTMTAPTPAIAPDQHEALGAEGEHARLLGEDQAERGQRKGHREAGNVAEPVDEEIHQPTSPHPVDAMADEELRRRDRDDDDRLDELNHGAGDLVEDLQALAGDEEHADEAARRGSRRADCCGRGRR